MNVQFAVIDLDANEPLAIFATYDEAETCREELDINRVRCIIDTVDDEAIAGYRL